jgi:hypothetical protein
MVFVVSGLGIYCGKFYGRLFTEAYARIFDFLPFWRVGIDINIISKFYL